MEDVIRKVIQSHGLTEDTLMRKNGPFAPRAIKLMTWVYLVRELRISYAKVAKRFGCTRYNVVWSVRNMEGAMEFQKSERDKYREFRKRAGI